MSAASLLDDAFAFVEQGDGSLSSVLELADALSFDQVNSTVGYYAWAGTMLDGLKMLRQLLVLETECLQGNAP